MLIPEERIEEVRALVDIVDVIGEYVALKPRGSNFVGLCPFHGEKTPSFNVNPQRGIFKCFGCGRGGDVFSFIREIEHVSYPQSIRLLAARVGVEIPEEGDSAREEDSDREAIHAALRFTGRFYYDTLIGEPGADKPESRGLTYFRGRGFSHETITRFGLGYSPPVWDSLLKAATAAHYRAEILEQAGLIIPRGESSGHYDRFRDRAMFPLFSASGKVVGFAGRLLSDEPDQPKYVNSPETEVYHKGEILYGLFQGRAEIRRKEEVYLVEGYTDVISLHQAGIKNAVATSGTALTRDQVTLLGRYAKSVVLVFDADAAGMEAARRGIDLFLQSGLGVKIVTLPDGADPDSFVRQFDGPAFRKYAERYRTDFVRFKIDHASRSGQMDSPEQKLEVIRDILSSVALISTPILQGEYLQEVGDALRIPDADLRDELSRLLDDRRRRAHREEQRSRIRSTVRSSQRTGPGDETEEKPVRGVFASPRILPEERLLLRLMLEGHEIEYVQSSLALEEFSEGPSRRLAEGLFSMFSRGNVTVEPFVNGSFGPEVQRLATDVLSDRYDLSINWKEKLGMDVPPLHDNPREVVRSAMRLLKRDRVEDAIRALQSRMLEIQNRGGDISPQLAEMNALQTLRRAVERGEWLDRNGS